MLLSHLRSTTLESEDVHDYAHPVSFGSNVKRLRKARGMKAMDLAEQLGVKGGTLSDWERDRRGIPEGPTLIRFAKTLGCSLDDLLAGVDPAYDEIVIGLRDLSSHDGGPESNPRKGGSIDRASSTSSRIQQLEQQLREQDRLIREVEAAAIKVVRLFTTTEENRRARAHQSGRRVPGRKAG